MKYVTYCIYMLLDEYGALMDRIDWVLGQKCKICTTDPKKLTISIKLAYSEFPQNSNTP